MLTTLGSSNIRLVREQYHYLAHSFATEVMQGDLKQILDFESG